MRVLDDLVATQETVPLVQQQVDGGTMIMVGRHIIVGVTPADIDDAVGETIQSVADRTVVRLRQAMDEATEARRPGVWLKAGAIVLLTFAIGVALL